VIEFISKYYVPVGINLDVVRPGKGPDAEFYRSVYKQKPQYQGFWIVSPEGKVLAAHHSFKSHKTWPTEVLAVLEEGRRAFGEIEPRRVRWQDPLPFRGRGIQPDGSVTLAIYVRGVVQGRPHGIGVLDSVTFSAQEFEAFAPTNRTVGSTWIIPDRIARKFSRCLSPVSDLVTMPRPADVTDVALTGKIHAIRDDTAILTYSGRLAAVHRHSHYKEKTNQAAARIEGVAELDLKTRKLRALALVCDGVYRDFPPYDGGQQIVAGVEWVKQGQK
jgi:hypothetical protein